MTINVDRVFQAVQQLSPAEQLELIQVISQSLRRTVSAQHEPDAIPVNVKRTTPVTDLSQLVADFWPEDETADAINAFVAQQRAEDRAY
jgi:hypothetical protein